MTPNTTHDIRSYHFTDNDQLLFDANIWLFNYGPQLVPPDWRTNIYTRAVQTAIAAGSKIFLDVLVLSEFINRYARLEQGVKVRMAGAPTDFKQFRKSVHYPSTAKNIAQDVSRIMRYSARIRSEFDSLDIVALMNEFEALSSDFNDLVISNLCSVNSLILVTDDGDFIGSGLTILTANRRLLSP